MTGFEIAFILIAWFLLITGVIGMIIERWNKREKRKLMKDNYKKINGVEYDVNKRWEDGIEHHEKSIELMERIAEIDCTWNDDSFGWKMGGDGDNGESLMYILDIIFDEDDKRKNTSNRKSEANNITNPDRYPG